MNAKETIDKIANLLGLKFKSEKFYTTLLVDGETTVTNNIDGPFEVGQVIYIVGESTLNPAPAGEHELRDGYIIVLDEDSVITEIKEVTEEVVEEEEEVEEEMSQEDETKEDITEEVEEELSEEVELKNKVESLSTEIETIKEGISSMLSLVEKLNEGFNSDINKIKDEFESFKNEPQREPKEKKVNVKDKFNDYRLELIRELRNK